MKHQSLINEQLIDELAKLRQENIELRQALKDRETISAVSEWSSPSHWFATGRNEMIVSPLPQQQPTVNHPIKYKFSDLVDIPFIQKLLNSFYVATGISHTLIDNDNNILSRAGWQEICTQFHRICPQTECRCRQSDSYIAAHLHDRPYVGYKCMNGLIDYAAPIIMEGQHLATIFKGQVLHEPPDEDFFRRQAQEYGFDEAAYVEALRRVPIIPEEQIESIMEFYSQLGQFLATMGLERKRQLEAADQTIREQQERLNLIGETSNDGFWDWNIERDELYLSPRWGEILGYSQDELKPEFPTWRKLVHPDDINATMKAISEYLHGRTARYEAEYRMRTKSGGWKWIMARGQIVDRNEKGKPLRMAGINLDITEQKIFQREVERLDRLNLVGEMAASIGHEIRNPMTTIRGFLQILRENKVYIEEIEFFDLMIEELDRANSIITEFLSLAKNKIVEKTPLNLNSIISKSLPLIQAKAISRDQYIKLEMDDLPNLLLDQKEIRQLILNLVNNGMESMNSAGDVTIRTVVEKGDVVLSVQDQGHGIEHELLDKLGTPFITTKDQGTGLGLPVCYRIAVRHNAKIDIETSSTGTTFYVRFPIPNTEVS